MGLDNPLHIAFLVVILLLVFGARRLPEIGRSLGSGMREFKQGISGHDPAQQQAALPAAQQQVAQPQVAQPQPAAQPAPVAVQPAEAMPQPPAGSQQAPAAPEAAPAVAPAGAETTPAQPQPHG